MQVLSYEGVRSGVVINDLGMGRTRGNVCRLSCNHLVYLPFQEWDYNVLTVADPLTMLLELAETVSLSRRATFFNLPSPNSLAACEKPRSMLSTSIEWHTRVLEGECTALHGILSRYIVLRSIFMETLSTLNVCASRLKSR